MNHSKKTSIEEEFESLKRQLSVLEKKHIIDANDFLYQQVYKKVLPDKVTDDAIKYFLEGKSLEVEEQKKFCSKHKLVEPNNFRNKTRKEGQIQDIDTLSKYVAFYWIRYQFSQTDLKIFIDPKSSSPIKITIESQKLYFPNDLSEPQQYVVFYPRSKMDHTYKVGLFTLTMYRALPGNDDLISEKQFNQGVHQTEFFYSQHTMKYEGTYHEDMLFTYFRNTNFLSEPDPDTIPVLASFNFQERSAEEKGYVLGTFTSANHKTKRCFAVPLIAYTLNQFMIKAKKAELTSLDYQKFVERQEYQLISNEESLINQITYFLYNQRIAPQYPNVLNVLEIPIPFANESNEIERLAGYYQCYFLKGTNGNVSIARLGVKISPQGMVVSIEDPKSNKTDNDFNGTVQFVYTGSGQQKKIVLHLNPDYEFHYHKHTIIADIVIENDITWLKGAFLKGGELSPRAGKIILEKVDSEAEIVYDTQIFYPEDETWRNKEAVTNFFSSREYLPSYYRYINPPIKPIPALLRDKETKKQINLAIFVIFKEESNNEESPSKGFHFRKPKFIQMPLELFENGTFKVESEEKVFIEGSYVYAQDKLILTSTQSPYFERFHFSLYGPRGENNFQHAYGTLTLFNRENNPESRSCVLSKVNTNEYAFYEYDQALELKMSSDVSLRNASTFLFTNEFNRIIRMPKRYRKIKTSFDVYRRFYFYSAKSIWFGTHFEDKEFTAREKKSLIFRYLENALLQGFAAPVFLDTVREDTISYSDENKYPNELRIDFDMLLELIRDVTLTDADFAGKIAELYQIKN
jgi:hypothetical protein